MTTRCRQCREEHPGRMHLWGTANMNDDKVERWGAFLRDSGVEYDPDRNLVPEWVTYVMHTKLDNVQRREVLRAVQACPPMLDAIKSIRRLLDREARGPAMLDVVRGHQCHA